MSLKKLSFLLVLGLLVQMSLALAVVNFRVVVPDGTTFVVGESSEVQVWLDVPAAEPLFNAEFNLLSDPLDFNLDVIDGLTAGFFSPQPVVAGSNFAFGLNGWTFGEEIASDGPLVSAPEGRLFATISLDAIAPGESTFNLGGLSARGMSPAGAGSIDYETAFSTPVTITVVCPSGQVPSADGENCVHPITFTAVPSSVVVGERSDILVALDVPADFPITQAGFTLTPDNDKAEIVAGNSISFFPPPSVILVNIAAEFGGGWFYSESGGSTSGQKNLAALTVQGNHPGETTFSFLDISTSPAGMLASTPLTITVTCPSGQVPSADGASCVPGDADPLAADPAVVLDTLLTNIRAVLTDGSTSQLQKISAIARLLRDYFAS